MVTASAADLRRAGDVLARLRRRPRRHGGHGAGLVLAVRRGLHGRRLRHLFPCRQPRQCSRLGHARVLPRLRRGRHEAVDHRRRRAGSRFGPATTPSCQNAAFGARITCYCADRRRARHVLGRLSGRACDRGSDLGIVEVGLCRRPRRRPRRSAVRDLLPLHELLGQPDRRDRHVLSRGRLRLADHVPDSRQLALHALWRGRALHGRPEVRRGLRAPRTSWSNARSTGARAGSAGT